MANIKSQIKRNRQNEKRRMRNRTVRSEMKTRTRTVLASANAGEETEESLKAAIKTIDKAASQGVIHKNKAARDKSRLVKRINALTEED